MFDLVLPAKLDDIYKIILITPDSYVSHLLRWQISCGTNATHELNTDGIVIFLVQPRVPMVVHAAKYLWTKTEPCFVS